MHSEAHVHLQEGPRWHFGGRDLASASCHAHQLLTADTATTLRGATEYTPVQTCAPSIVCVQV